MYEWEVRKYENLFLILSPITAGYFGHIYFPVTPRCIHEHTVEVLQNSIMCHLRNISLISQILIYLPIQIQQQKF